MKKTMIKIGLSLALLIPAMSNAQEAKGLNVLINSGVPQTQAMAMVLSRVSLQKYKKEVNIVLCGKAGHLANKNTKGVSVKRPNGKAPTTKQQLKRLIKLGANVQVCPLYLPNAGKTKSILLNGITIAKPGVVASKLLNKDYQNLTF